MGFRDIVINVLGGQRYNVEGLDVSNRAKQFVEMAQDYADCLDEKSEYVQTHIQKRDQILSCNSRFDFPLVENSRPIPLDYWLLHPLLSDADYPDDFNKSWRAIEKMALYKNYKDAIETAPVPSSADEVGRIHHLKKVYEDSTGMDFNGPYLSEIIIGSVFGGGLIGSIAGLAITKSGPGTFAGLILGSAIGVIIGLGLKESEWLISQIHSSNEIEQNLNGFHDFYLNSIPNN